MTAQERENVEQWYQEMDYYVQKWLPLIYKEHIDKGYWEVPNHKFGLTLAVSRMVEKKLLVPATYNSIHHYKLTEEGIKQAFVACL